MKISDLSFCVFFSIDKVPIPVVRIRIHPDESPVSGTLLYRISFLKVVANTLRGNCNEFIWIFGKSLDYYVGKN
jgi:hypothetical protein